MIEAFITSELERLEQVMGRTSAELVPLLTLPLPSLIARLNGMGVWVGAFESWAELMTCTSVGQARKQAVGGAGD